MKVQHESTACPQLELFSLGRAPKDAGGCSVLETPLSRMPVRPLKHSTAQILDLPLIEVKTHVLACGLSPRPSRIMAMRYLICAVTVLTMAPSILWARSDEIPTPDVRPVCRGIASQSADPGVGRTTFATKSLTTSVRLDGDE